MEKFLYILDAEMSNETYAQMKARIDRERALQPVWDVDEIAAQEEALRLKWVEEFGTDPPEPVTHLYNEQGTAYTDNNPPPAPQTTSPSDAAVEVISQQPLVAPKAVKPTKATGK